MASTIESHDPLGANGLARDRLSPSQTIPNVPNVLAEKPGNNSEKDSNSKESLGRFGEKSRPANDEDVLGPDRYPGQGTEESPFVVDWDRDDPENPYNWPKRRRWLCTAQVCNYAEPAPHVSYLLEVRSL